MNDALLILGIPALIGAAIGYTICFFKMRNTTPQKPQHIDLSEIKEYCEDIENRAVSASNSFVKGWFKDDVQKINDIYECLETVYSRMKKSDEKEERTHKALVDLFQNAVLKTADDAEMKEKMQDMESEIIELRRSINSLSYRPRNIIADRISNKD
ncbi:hypothetical protein EW704_11865 [Salmonella enterica]|nr:hypothetical protein [Salmonella enterica]ECS5628517.1 hypothetical protein [Salmonella enterica subsp. enterica serovar Oranienburg]EBH7047571.1 hypothetical protein [Salmonella enterica]EBK7780300.1 hypothetical protein [Salmonella enterica]EDW9372203.1 hypothetical protein [Salmonella enterica subsp. enterica serovar Oranienburg]